jgi:hypothetical protein
MALTLITRKISYNNVLKLLEFGTDSTYTELLNHPSSDYYNELAKLLEELHYDGPINYRSIYKFLLINVWNKQPEHFRIIAGKTYYDGPSFVDDENVEKLAFKNRKLKAPGFKKTTRKKVTPKKEVPKKVTSLKKISRRNNNRITPLDPTPIINTNTKNIRHLSEIKEDIPFYNENQEINDFITGVHASEPTFHVGEYDNEHPCIVLCEPNIETEFLDELHLLEEDILERMF